MEDHGLDGDPGAPGPDAAAAGAPDRTGTATHRRFRHLRHYARSLSFLGLAFGWLFFVVSLTPSLLPRSWQAQGFVSGCAVAQGYGLGVAMAWTGRHIGVPRPSAATLRQGWYALGMLTLVTVPVILWLSLGWQNDIRRTMGVPATGPTTYIGVFVIAAGVAAAIVGLVRLIHDFYVMLVRRLSHFLPGGVASLAATVLVIGFAVGIASGFADQVLLRIADLSSSAANNGNEPGVARPASPFRSGSGSSLIAWRSLGKQGRAFVSGGPTVADIERLTGRPAIEPIRVYAGLASAPTLQGEANLVLRELIGTGAFRRALLAIATPTGSGLVGRGAADPLEYMYRGNTAIAAMQYSYLPSWIAFLTQRAQARQAGQALFDTVDRYWSSLPPGHRPKLVVFGESLGAFGAEAPFSGAASMAARTSGALFVGPPNDSHVWRALTNARAKGSPEWLPIYHGGRTVRFAASVSDLRLPGGGLRHPKIVYLQHSSDPVVWWSPGLIVHEPDWLAERRGPDVTPQMRWYPFVTFWQVTADLIVSITVPPGHGHNYGPQIPTAWAAILHPPGWTSAETARLNTSETDGELP